MEFNGVIYFNFFFPHALLMGATSSVAPHPQHILNLPDNNAPQMPSCGATETLELIEQIQRLILELRQSFIDEEGRHVNYEAMVSSHLFSTYCTKIKQLPSVDLGTLTEVQRKCFFLNLYNALTIHGIIHASSLPKEKERHETEEDDDKESDVVGGLIKLPPYVTSIKRFWRNTAYIVGPHIYSLDDIEHGILRTNKPHPTTQHLQFPKGDPRLAYCLTKLDPRIHFALVCGAVSCPPIQIYSPHNLEFGLESATRNFCSNIKIDSHNWKVELSQIFQWYSSDFGETNGDVLRWLLPYLPESNRKLSTMLEIQEVKISYSHYDWHVNATINGGED
jgi:hypothetical protein